MCMAGFSAFSDSAAAAGSTPVTETFTTEDSVELALVERSGFVESRHIGSAVVVDPAGEVTLALGDVTAPIFARSTLKFFQTLASLAVGAKLEGPQLAIATASHWGTPGHVALAREILHSHGVAESELQCPADFPGSREARDQVVLENGGPLPVYYNCSGKHAAFLAACAAAGLDRKHYLEPDHELQKQVRSVIERMTGERPAASGIDGCGAPVHAISLTALARGLSKMQTSAESSPFALYRNSARILTAIRRDPWIIQGEGGANTVCIRELGVIAKGGAEGILVMAAPDGTTVAVKCLDGSSRATTLVGLGLLSIVGALDAKRVQAVLPKLRLDIEGGGRPVGSIRLSPVVTQARPIS